jgi:hypothetical protein
LASLSFAICMRCNGQFERMHPRKKYCDKNECRPRRQGRPGDPCEVCGKACSRPGLRFCSYACLRKRPKRGALTERFECVSCKKEYFLNAYEASRREGRACHACSRACYYLWKRSQYGLEAGIDLLGVRLTQVEFASVFGVCSAVAYAHAKGKRTGLRFKRSRDS